MTPRRRAEVRHGYTLLEMVIALPLVTLLILGSTGAIGIVSRIAESGSATADTTMRAPAALELMTAEIESATAVTARTSTSLTITTTDRTGDAVDDTIAFAWSGTPGAPLTRQLNGGAPETLLGGLQSLAITHNTATVGATTVLQSIDLRLTPSSTSAEITARIRLLNEPVAP